MEFVEEGDLDGPELDSFFDTHLKEYLTPDTETIVLGCTHYPFIKPRLKEYLNNDGIDIIDGSLGTARELKRRLNEKGLLKKGSGKGNIVLLNSSDSPEMRDRALFLLEKNGIALA